MELYYANHKRTKYRINSNAFQRNTASIMKGLVFDYEN